MATTRERRSLLSSPARVQVPWVSVTIGSYVFGVLTNGLNNNSEDKYGKKVRSVTVDDDGNYHYETKDLKYPNYVQSLKITKINGQVNQYELSIKYPITQFDDPNFFEKVFSSVSGTRKIIFSYGDASMPTYVYKDEEAIITDVNQIFDLSGSSITYTVKAVSGAALKSAGNISWPAFPNPQFPSSAGNWIRRSMISGPGRST